MGEPGDTKVGGGERERIGSGRPKPGSAPLGIRRVAITAIICVAIAATVVGLLPRAKVMLRLQSWSEKGPREAIGRLCTAIEAADADSLRAVFADANQVAADGSDEVLVRVGAGGTAAVLPVSALRVERQAAESARLEYSYSDALPGVGVTLPLEGGNGTLILDLDRPNGEWKVMRLRMRGGAMRDLKTGLAPMEPGSGPGPGGKGPGPGGKTPGP